MNYKEVILLGFDTNSKRIVKLFNDTPDLGYRYQGFFSDKENDKKECLGTLKDVEDYIKNNNVDEIYCSISSLKKNQIKHFTKVAGKNAITFNIIPESDELYSKNFKAEYYNNNLVLRVKNLPLENFGNRFVKRFFDIIFSLLILIFIMSWLVPLLGLLIKLESKGSVFFKQEREGLKGNKFICYKFRSMKINKIADTVHATQNDDRVTIIGAFIRKTSIDELPQFYNVLKGDMSVVGPRPHVENLAKGYLEKVSNYMKRHTVKPGITGLAQVSGCRGEVIKVSDIKNRVRLDIFYIENWSFLLDIKIIIQTVLNVFKGDEKAY